MFSGGEIQPFPWKGVGNLLGYGVEAYRLQLNLIFALVLSAREIKLAHRNKSGVNPTLGGGGGRVSVTDVSADSLKLHGKTGENLFKRDSGNHFRAGKKRVKNKQNVGFRVGGQKKKSTFHQKEK